MKHQKADGCPYCGGIDGCHLTTGFLGRELSLTVDDWRKVYWFVKYVQLPFIHQIIANARDRKIANQTRRSIYHS